MLLILTINICNDYPEWSSNTGQKMEQEKTRRYWWKITNKRQYSLFYKNDFEKTMWYTEEKNKIRTIKTEIDTKNSLSKFGKQICTVINKEISKDNLSTKWGVISTTDKQIFDKYCNSI